MNINTNKTFTNTMPWTNVQVRNGGFPLDKYSIFESYDKALEYVNSPAQIAYEGQIIAVTVEDKQIAYVVDSTVSDGLRRVGQDPVQISADISAIAAAYSLSSIQTLNIEQGSLSAENGKMIDQIWEENGIIKATFRDLTISEVSSLQKALDDITNDLTTLTSSTLVTLSNNLTADAQNKANAAKAAGELSAQTVRNDLESNYVKYTDVTKTITSTNKIVTQEDIKDLSGAMHFVGIAEVAAGETTQQALVRTFPTSKKGDVAIISGTAAEYVYIGDEPAIEENWRLIGDEGVYATKAALEAETQTRTANDDYLSSKIDSKIKVGNGKYDGSTESYDINDLNELSIIKIANDDYYRLVSEEKINESALYIISSDNINGYNQRIINVGDGICSSDAINYGQVSAISSIINDSINAILTSYISCIKINDQLFDYDRDNALASLSIDVISCGNAA